MSSRKETILVTGATGKQGGAVARHLLAAGWQVRALTRNPEGEKAVALKKQGVEMIAGDMENRAILEKGLENVYGVFSVQNFWEHGYDGEVRQGKTLANAAKQAGVAHFVYTSVASADRKTGLPHFECKWLIEEHIRGLNLPSTIVRPVFFMDNFQFSREQIMEGTLVNAMLPNIPLQTIAVDNIGAFVELAFSKPGEFIGKVLDIAGDAKTFPEVADTFSRAIGKPVHYTQMSLEDFQKAMGNEYALMVDWFNRVGYDVDIDALRLTYPVRLTTLEEWVRKTGWGK